MCGQRDARSCDSKIARVPEENGSQPERSSPALVLELTSEFGAVSVAVDNEANGPRLRIENLQNRQTIYLDPLELVSSNLILAEVRGVTQNVYAGRVEHHLVPRDNEFRIRRKTIWLLNSDAPLYVTFLM
jgi:hypothetical protein